MLEARNDNVSLPLLYLLLAITACLLIWNYSADIFSGVSIYYNEGPLLEQSMRLLAGETIYRADISTPPYTVSNYGPVFHFLQLPFLAMFGPTFIPGRIISFLSYLASALFAGLIMRRFTGSAGAALVTGLMVLSSPLVGAIMPLYRVDVLAQAFSLAGLYAAIFIFGRRGICLAALLFTAAVYAKQTYILAAPATAFFYLLLQKETKRAWMLAGITTALTGLTFITGQWMTGGGFAFHLITANLNEYFFSRFLSHLSMALLISPIAVAVVFLVILRKHSLPSARRFCLIYLVGAAAVSLSVGKDGSNLGYFSEIEVAFAFWMGLLATGASRSRPAKPANELHLLLVIQVLFHWHFLIYSSYHETLRGAYDEQTQLQRLITETSGPVLADRHMGMLVLAGKPIYYQPFEIVQLWVAGRWRQEAFLEDLQQRKFHLILIENIYGATRWTPQMMKAIHDGYRLTGMLDNTMLLTPKLSGN